MSMMKKIIEQIKILKTEQNKSDNNVDDPGFPESQPNIDDLLDELLDKVINEEINFDMESIVRFLTSRGMVEENAKELAKSFMNEYNDIFGNNENQSDNEGDENQSEQLQSEEENDIDKELQKSKVIKSLVYLNDHIINKVLNDFEKQLEEIKHYLEDIPQKKEPIMKSQNKSYYVDNNIKLKLLKALKENQINLYDYSLYIQKGILTDKAKLYINNE